METRREKKFMIGQITSIYLARLGRCCVAVCSMYFFAPIRRLTSLSTNMPPGRHRLSGWSDDISPVENGVPGPLSASLVQDFSNRVFLSKVDLLYETRC